MKRREFLRHLRENQCVADEKGRASTLYRNQINGAVATVPNDPDPDDVAIRYICRALDIPLPKSISARSSSARAGRRVRTRKIRV